MNPFSKDKYYFLACSGGVDSMVLAYLMCRANISFEILHVNFQLRGSESDADEELVIDFGKKNGITTHTQRFDTPSIHAEKGGNLEELCRDLRYNWFQTFLDSKPNAQLVVAHHLDDQLETFYWQLSRKAGIVGLSSLKVETDTVIRPLLSYSKNEIYAFAIKHQIPWREDKSNHENKFTRNKLRNVFLPFLKNEITHLTDSVTTLISAFQQTKSTFENEIKSEVNLTNHFLLPIEVFTRWNSDKKHIFLNLIQLRSSVLNELEKLTTAQTGKFIQSSNWFISKKGNVFEFDKIHDLVIPEICITTVTELPTSFSKNELFLDQSKIKGKLSIRLWQTGDKLEAIGVNGSKLISKILNEFHLSTFMKQRVFVLTDEETIHWIIGYKIGRKAIANKQTKHIVKIAII